LIFSVPSPWGWASYDAINWYLHYGGKKIFDDLFGKVNMVLFSQISQPRWNQGIRSRVPIKTLADYKGKKLRMSGRRRIYPEKACAAQVMISGGEYTRPCRWGPSTVPNFQPFDRSWKMGFSEVTKYCIASGWHQPS